MPMLFEYARSIGAVRYRVVEGGGRGSLVHLISTKEGMQGVDEEPLKQGLQLGNGRFIALITCDVDGCSSCSTHGFVVPPTP